MLLSNGNTGQTFSLCLFPHWKHYYVCSVKVKAIKAHSTEICFEQPLKSLEHNKIYIEKTSRLIKWISECNSEAGHNDFSMQSIIYTLCWSQYPPPPPPHHRKHVHIPRARSVISGANQERDAPHSVGALISTVARQLWSCAQVQMRHLEAVVRLTDWLIA